MAQIQGVEIAKCSSCREPIGNQNSATWCLNCGEPLPEEVKAQIPRLAAFTTITTSKQQQTNQSQTSDGLVSAMHFIGWGNLIASVVLAFIILKNLGSASSPLAVGTIVGVIAQGIIVLVFCLTLARILENVANIRSRLEKMSTEEKPLR